MPGKERKTVLFSLLGAALVILIASTAILLNGNFIGQQSTTVATGATPTSTPQSGTTAIPPTATPQGSTPVPHATPGWESAGPGFALSIAFAPSLPSTVYVCGPDPGVPPLPNVARQPGISNPQPQLAVGVSHDGGATWEVYGTHADAVHCNLSISPTNPQEVALVSDQNDANCSPCGGSEVFISTDGGKHWNNQILPLESVTQLVAPTIDSVTWVSDILFATPHEDLGFSYPHALAKSVHGGPFQWASQSALPSLGDNISSIGEIFSQGTALYALVDEGACPAVCYQLVRSTDGGATWVVPSGNFSLYIQAWAGMDGTTLYALTGRLDSPYDTIAVTHDAGNSWHTLPTLPGNIPVGQNLFALADGTLYCPVNGIPAGFGLPGTQSGIYRLAPGARAWKYVSSLPTADTLLAVQPGADGHALALWGQGNFDATLGVVGAGLQRHAP